jgi:hypothetical protein
MASVRTLIAASERNALKSGRKFSLYSFWDLSAFFEKGGGRTPIFFGCYQAVVRGERFGFNPFELFY